jgi:hypothetical protein
MNPTPRPLKQGPVSGLVPSAVAEPSRSIAEADEAIPLTIPLDRPEPAQPQLSPEPEPQPVGELARDDEWE